MYALGYVIGLILRVLGVLLLVAALLGLTIWGGTQIVRAFGSGNAPPPPQPVQPPPTGPVQPPPSGSPGFSLHESEGGIPYAGASWATDVAPDEIEVLTAGPLRVAGVSLSGGAERGSVLLLLPGTNVVPYQVSGLIAGSNWHGAYRPVANPSAEETWRPLANDRVAAMRQAPNCSSGRGCNIVDVLIVGPGPKVVAQWTVQ